IGGATANAVGDRLKRLSDSAQILVVTHSPQVAACGDSQYQISKGDKGNITRTSVRQLGNSERREEIARMLAGEEITDAARAAADQLLQNGL
ncbi:MAG: DNA repair protein RecN, partial [Kordiimonas sp.]